MAKTGWALVKFWRKLAEHWSAFAENWLNIGPILAKPGCTFGCNFGEKWLRASIYIREGLGFREFRAESFGFRVSDCRVSGNLEVLNWAFSNQGEKSINFHFIMVPVRKTY